MELKRKARNTACWLLATVIILLGYVKRAKNESFQDGIITPVYFHNPDRKLFRKIVVWLKKNGYSFISCDQLREILNHKIACPRGAVWLSLDDGWKGNIDNVIPVAVEYNIPITIFIYTDAAENGTFWWTKVSAYARLLPAELRQIEAIKRLPEDSRRQVLELLTQAEPQGDSRREAMTVEDVRRISAMPQVTIGSHTVTHPILPNCRDHQVDYELAESKRKLEEWTGKPVYTLAYPNGSFDGRERRFLKKHGYKLAATIENNLARSNGDCYLLPRTDVMDDGSFAENLCHAMGVWKPAVNRFKRIIKPGG
jgi:peptidoglycan/xylan/chitin deacetylase (PgdA/CDA1 family)